MIKQRILSFLFYLSISLCFILGAAHFYRVSLYPLAFLCMLCMVMAFQKAAYVRIILALALVALGVRYCFVTMDFIHMRQALGQPWLRLWGILGTVSFFIFCNAFMMYRQKDRYTKNMQLANVSTITFLVIFAVLACINYTMPHLMLANRIYHGSGIVLAFFMALWGAFLVTKLSDTSIAEQWRVRIWQIFSLVFFGQFALALIGYTIFLMGDAFHFPIPAMVIAGPLYRESGFFMPILFLVSFVLVGSAWCSHLCYFGVWDTVSSKSMARRQYSQHGQHNQAKAIMGQTMQTIFKALPYAIFMAMIAFVFICKHYTVPTSVIFSLILFVGLALFPMHFFISRPYAISSYCLYICPLGLMMRMLNAITRHRFSWHISFTDKCTQCGMCSRFCRYKAITKESIQTQTIAQSCTLCRNCMHVCRKHGLELSYCGFKMNNSATMNSIFTSLITILHALFLAVAMV